MAFVATLPLHFPQDGPACIERRLWPYPGPPDEELSSQELAQRLVQRPDCYAILSAAGTGKTSLLNAIRYRLQRDSTLHNTVVIGPIDLSVYRREQEIGRLLSNLWLQITDELAASGFTVDRSDIGQHAEARFVPALQAALERLEREGEAMRMLLLLDNLEHLPLNAAIQLGARLRNLYENSGDRFLFFLTADADLAALYTEIWSPLAGIVQPYTLADFTPDDLSQTLGRALWQIHHLNLTDPAWTRLYEQTRGYPYLVHAILQHLIASSPRDTLPRSAVDQAVQAILDRAEPAPPFKRAWEAVADTDPKDLWLKLEPVELLLQLLGDRTGVTEDEPGARLLLIKGVLNWTRQDKTLTWRNPMIRAFMAARRKQLEALLPGPETPRLRSTLYATGTVYVSLFLDFRRFIARSSKKDFDRLRGSEDYATAVWALKDHIQQQKTGAFCYYAEQDRLRDIGLDLDLFRERMVNFAFTPIYQLRDPAKTLPVSSSLQERLKPGEKMEDYQKIIQAEWENWDRISVQLTRDGAVHVCLEKDITMPAALIDILNLLLGLRKDLDTGEISRIRNGKTGKSLQWEIAFSVIEHFIRGHFEQSDGRCRWTSRDRISLDLAPAGERDEKEGYYPLRNRYVIYVFDKICNCGEADKTQHRILEFDDFSDEQHPHYAAEVLGLLEGVMIADDKKREGHFPEIKRHRAPSMLASDILLSWEAEIFVASLDNALIYYRSREALYSAHGSREFCPRCGRPEKMCAGNLYFSHHTVSYQDYWRCIVHLLEFVIALRLSTQLVAHDTIDLLTDTINLFTEPGNLNVEAVRHLRSRVAKTVNILSHLRNASIPMSMTSTSYGVRKYNKLIELSGISKTIEHAEANVRDVNAFLQHYDSQQEQKLDRRMTRTFSWTAVLLAVLTTVLTVPSFWIDLEQSYFGRTWNVWLVWLLRGGVPIFIAVSLILAIIWVWRRNRLS